MGSTYGYPMGMGTLWTLGTHMHKCMNTHKHACTNLAHHLLCLCHQVERDALKRKCEELRQDLEREKLHAWKGPFGKGPFGKGPMPDDVDDVGHEDKKAIPSQSRSKSTM